MNLEPQKFFIGLTDFFSIILPGAILTYLLKTYATLCQFEKVFKIEEGEGLAVFLFSSYLLGHFIFLIGASFLDDFVYEKIRRATHSKQIERLAKVKNLSPRSTRFLAKKFFSRYIDPSLKKVLKIKEHYLNPLGATSSINAFQWSKAKINLENSAVLSTVQRFEADSKFFRSLVVVLVIAIPLTLITGNGPIAVISIPMLLFALWRYINQRTKSVMQAYWYIITMEANNKDGFRFVPEKRKDNLTHAGGVVFKIEKRVRKYLLVQAKNRPDEWVLPKGHIKQGESTEEAAIREVREEAGVWAYIKSPLKDISLSVNEENQQIKIYLMECLEENKKEENDNRKRRWLRLDEAMKEDLFPEIIKVLELADSTVREYKK